jgi:hypothetical protein
MQSFRDIDPTDVVVENVVPLKQGRGTLVRLCRRNGQKFIFQTPLLPLAWNVHVRQQDNGGTSCSLPLSFGGTNKNVVEFKEWLLKVDQTLHKILADNSQTWTGKAMSLEAAADSLTSLVKAPPPDTTYNEAFVAKIAHSAVGDGTFKIDVRVFDVEKTIQDPDVLRRGAKAGAIIQIPYLHIGKLKSVVPRVDATQIIVIPVPDEDEFAFNLDADEDVKAAATDASSKKRKLDVLGEPAIKEDECIMAPYDNGDDV